MGWQRGAQPSAVWWTQGGIWSRQVHNYHSNDYFYHDIFDGIRHTVNHHNDAFGYYHHDERDDNHNDLEVPAVAGLSALVDVGGL